MAKKKDNTETVAAEPKKTLNKLDGTFDKEKMLKFIVQLAEDARKYLSDTSTYEWKQANHVFYYAVRNITENLGHANFYISKEAQKKKASENTRDHVIPAVQFYHDFLQPDFDRKKAESWFINAARTARFLSDGVAVAASMAIISNDENTNLNKAGWRDKNRPRDAYKKLEIKLDSLSVYLIRKAEKHRKDKDWLKKALKDASIFSPIPSKVHTIAKRLLCLETVKLDGLQLAYLGIRQMDEEICQAAVNQNKDAIKFVPEKIKAKMGKGK
jgi:hypothetical protein